MFFGFLDGRKGIPELAELSDRVPSRANGSAVGLADDPYLPTNDLPATGEPMPAPRVRTPRIDTIIREANVRIETEWCRLVDDRAILTQRMTGHQVSLDALGKELLTTEGRLAEARHPLNEEERDLRRLAESDPESRPAGLVRARRLEAWDRRRAAAEQRHHSVTGQWAQAHRHARLDRDLIGEREAVARAAARRHHEYALRRIATYLQQLVRSHPQGRKLNSLLAEYQVGPDLPEWTKEPTIRRPGEDSRPSDGGAVTT